MSDVTRVAVVGCGAAAEIHLTVLAGLGAEVACLVDIDAGRAAEMAAKYGVEATLGDHRELEGRVDAAVLALPHHLHAPLAVDLLESGIDVLVEKPMALSVEECDAMIEAASSAGRTLAVGMARRFYDAGRWVRRLLELERLGELERLDVREGYVYDWPVTTDFMFRREAGGGVLADAGAHILDNLLWWLGDFESVEYRDDARGGVAADCELDLVMKSGVVCFVELSRTRRLRNTWRLEGSAGRLEVDTLFNPEVRWEIDDGPEGLEGRVRADGRVEEEALDCFRRQMEDFLDARASGRRPRVDGSEGRRFVELYEACVANRGDLELPWAPFRP